MSPEERRDERRPAVSAGREVDPPARLEHELRELRAVRVARLVELRPAVVVAAVRIGAPGEQKTDELEPVRHAEEVVAVRPACLDELGMRVEERLERGEVVCLDGAVGEDERRRRLRPVPDRLDAAFELGPALEAVAACEVEPRLVDRDPADGRDPLGAALVVADVGVERFLGYRLILRMRGSANA